MILLFPVSVLQESVEDRRRDEITESGPQQEFLEEVLKFFRHHSYRFHISMAGEFQILRDLLVLRGRQILSHVTGADS